MASTDQLGYTNYWKDECLQKTNATARLDFAQIHCYATLGRFRETSALAVDAATYDLARPVVVGETSAASCAAGLCGSPRGGVAAPPRTPRGSSAGPDTSARAVRVDATPLWFRAQAASNCSIEGLFDWAADHGYNGIWDWALIDADGNDNETVAVVGMAEIASDARTLVTIGGSPPPDTCSCSDAAPDDEYTCEEQASWGKCGEAFMVGFCCRSCHACQGCS